MLILKSTVNALDYYLLLNLDDNSVSNAFAFVFHIDLVDEDLKDVLLDSMIDVIAELLFAERIS